MYVVCYLIANEIHPEDSEIKICGIFEDKAEAEEWAEEVTDILTPIVYVKEAKVYKTKYYPNTNKQKEK